jgi:hypothetical protein
MLECHEVNHMLKVAISILAALLGIGAIVISLDGGEPPPPCGCPAPTATPTPK